MHASVKAYPYKLKKKKSLALPSSPAFPHMPKRRAGAELMRVDLEAAGIPYEDEGGRVADFHALRHSFITNLAKGGVHPKVAQDLARHSDINLTLGTYTHTILKDRSEALNTLPDLSIPSSAQEAKATGTDDESVFAICFAKQVLQHASNQDQSGQLNTRKCGNPKTRRKRQNATKPPFEGTTGGEKNGEADETRTRNHQIDSLVR